MKPSVARFYWRHLAEARRVLDLGCGSGGIGAHKPDTKELHGMDLDPAAIQSVRGYTTARVWDLDDGQPLPFADDYFDAVIAKDILEHIQKPWLLVREIERVMAPGGRVIASVICYRGRRLWSDYTHVRGFTMTTATKLFTDGGFVVKRVWRMGPVPGTARLNAIHLAPVLLRVPLLDWMWTSSYELIAEKPAGVATKGSPL